MVEHPPQILQSGEKATTTMTRRVFQNCGLRTGVVLKYG